MVAMTVWVPTSITETELDEWFATYALRPPLSTRCAAERAARRGFGRALAGAPTVDRAAGCRATGRCAARWWVTKWPRTTGFRAPWCRCGRAGFGRAGPPAAIALAGTPPIATTNRTRAAS